MSRAEVRRSAVPRHPHALMLRALVADAALHVCRVGAVPKVHSAGCRQGGLQLRGPLLVGLGKTPDLVGREVQIAKYASERLAGRDRVKELLAYFDWQALLRPGPPKRSLSVAVRPAAQGAAAPGASPPRCRRAVVTARTVAAAHRSASFTA